MFGTDGLRNLLSLGCAVVLAAGCGGGGDSSSAPSGGATPSLAITAANAESVAGGVLEASNDTGDVAELVQDASGLATLSEDSRAPSVAGLVMAQLERIVRPANGGLAALAVVEVTDSCGNTGGEATVILNDADDSETVTSGDFASIAFSNCRDDELGTTLDGSTAFTFTQVSGDPAVDTDFTVAFQVSFDQLTASDGTESATIDGSFDFTLAIAGGGTESSFTLAIERLSYAAGGVTDVVADGTWSARFDEASGEVEVRVDATLTLASLGGAVVIETVRSFQATASDDDPFDGELLVTGAGGASVRVIALAAGGPGAVRLEVDADADGAAETTILTTWEALRADSA